MSFFVWMMMAFLTLEANIIWERTEIIVPLHGDFRSALSEVEAKLYIDGEICEDARVIYKIDGVERTFLSTINTSIVKTYTHKIEAYFPDYNLRHVMTIQIKIIDDIPPEIVSMPSIRVRIGEKMPNLLMGFTAIDNYDLEESLLIRIDTSQVMDEQIGKYPITYVVKDLSGNETTKILWIEFYDDISPDITAIKPLKHNVDHIFLWQTYLDITDNYDMFPEVKIECDALSHNMVGIYPFKVIATDQSGNQKIVITSIEIYDQTPPSLIISNERPDIPYQIEDSMSILRKLIINVYDNVDEISSDDVKIFSSINHDVLGTYLVTYQIIDSSYNKTSVDIYLKVTDQEKPKIILIKPLLFHVFDPPPLFQDYIILEDNFSTNENIKIEIIGSYNMQKVGKYLLTFKATDESKNQSTLTSYLEVIDQTAPIITLIQEILITQFKPINYIPYFLIEDPYDDIKDLTLTVDDTSVDYQKIGVYPLIVTAQDASFNQSTLMVDVIIMDIEPPVLKLTVDDKIDYPYQGLPIDYISYISEVSDNHDDLSIFDVKIIGKVDPNQFGFFEIIYELSDSTGNKVVKTLEFIIIDHESPTIIFDELTINQYGSVDLLQGVTLEDNSNQIEIIYYPKVIDTSKPGSIIVTYIVTDERGNYVMKDRLVTILEIKTKPLLDQFIPFIIVIVIGISLSTFLYFKDVKHMF